MNLNTDACKTASIIVYRQGYLHVHGTALCVPAGDVTDLSTPALLSQADFVPTVSAFNIGHCYILVHCDTFILYLTQTRAFSRQVVIRRPRAGPFF